MNFINICERTLDIKAMYDAVKNLGMFIPEEMDAAKSLYNAQLRTLERQLELMEEYAAENDYEAVDDCWMVARSAAIRAVMCADAPRRANFVRG